MTADVENLILEHLRALRNKLDLVADDVGEVKQRVTGLEASHATMLQHVSHLTSQIAQ